MLRLHSGNGPHEEMDRRALEAFVLALDDAGLPDTELPNGSRLHRVLTDYFAWGISSMGQYHHSEDDVPAGLTLPNGSWDGLVPPPR